MSVRERGSGTQEAGYAPSLLFVLGGNESTKTKIRSGFTSLWASQIKAVSSVAERILHTDVQNLHRPPCTPLHRIALEEFLRCSIRDFQVTPERDDLAGCVGRHLTSLWSSSKTWP